MSGAVRPVGAPHIRTAVRWPQDDRPRARIELGETVALARGSRVDRYTRVILALHTAGSTTAELQRWLGHRRLRVHRSRPLAEADAGFVVVRTRVDWKTILALAVGTAEG